MENPNLLLICLNAFIAVLGLLTVLAGAIRGLIELFPERPPMTDTVVAVAIAVSVNAVTPGARVTRIEEIR